MVQVVAEDMENGTALKVVNGGDEPKKYDMYVAVCSCGIAS